MDRLTEINPFVVGKYVSERYFCDRSKETETLIRHLTNGRHVALIAPRRLGKSELIKHCFRQTEMTDNFYTFFVDIYATSTLQDLVYVLSRAVYEQLKPRTDAWREKFFQIVSSLRVGFKLDALTGEPTFDIGLGDISTPDVTLQQIFAYIAAADRPCVIAIDEFQQIGNYPEKNVEALLRTHMQQCENAVFVFAGSKRHVMAQMFNSPSQPFYSSAIAMELGPIARDTYSDFALSLFEQRGKSLNRNVVDQIYEQLHGITWFLQMMMNELFALTADGQCCTVDYIPVAWQQIMNTQDTIYRELMAHLSSRQKQLLQAIARAGSVKEITSGRFIQSHKLGTASSVQSALRVLLERQLVTQQDKCYSIYDPFFSHWIVGHF